LPATGTEIPYAALFKATAFAILMTTIAFWIGRILLRMYLSGHHLATDAEERRTMIMTFLALAKNKSVEENDRKLILTALFRPGSDGIVKDDAAPEGGRVAWGTRSKVIIPRPRREVSYRAGLPVTASPHSFCSFDGTAFLIHALASPDASLLRPGWESFDKHLIFKPGTWPLDGFERPFLFPASPTAPVCSR
jgi:Family of unknown function (DUF6161)